MSDTVDGSGASHVQGTDCPCEGGSWVNGSTRITAKVLQEQARLSAFLEVKKMVDGLNIGEAAQFGRAGAGMVRKWIRDEIDAKILAVLQPNDAASRR